MSGEPKWIGPMPDGITLYGLKKLIPAQSHATAIRVDFGLHGLLWVLKFGECLLATDNREIPIHEARLLTGGHVIGLRDIQSAGNRPWAHEWRSSMQDRIDDELTLGIAQK